MNNKNLLNYFSEQVNLYLDNRLTEDSKETLMKVIDEDPVCNKLYSSEKTFRDFVKNNVKRPSASVELINNIKNRIG